ncbi:hypothetical protein SLE2022_094060 [Rubroshorea leprosula]
MSSCFLVLASSLSFHLKPHSLSNVSSLATSLPAHSASNCNCRIVIVPPPASSQFVFDGLSISEIAFPFCFPLLPFQALFRDSLNA